MTSSINGNVRRTFGKYQNIRVVSTRYKFRQRLPKITRYLLVTLVSNLVSSSTSMPHFVPLIDILNVVFIGSYLNAIIPILLFFTSIVLSQPGRGVAYTNILQYFEIWAPRVLDLLGLK